MKGLNSFQELDFGQGTVIKQPTVNNQQDDVFQRQMIVTSFKKSYIYQMSGSKSQNLIINQENEQNKNLYKTRARRKIFSNIQKIEEQEQEQIQYFYFVSNIGKNQQNNINCCSYKKDPTLCTIQMTKQKQLYIKKKDTNQQLYSLNLNTISIDLDSLIQSEQYFIININQYTVLKIQNFKNIKSLEKIYNLIQNNLDKSLGKKYDMKNLPNLDKKFYQNKYKPAIQFIQHCQTGDILLFRGSHFFANVQRFFTNSNYDHVGMVIRDPVYGILIFQSNSSSGVCLTPFQLIIKYKWYQAISRIVWRKLQNVERGFKFQDLIHQFVLANIGKSYYISINKLLSNKSFIANNSEQVGFFCSELIAAIYKDLGLLTRDPIDPNFKPGCNFIPYHFTQRYDIKLEKGKLSDQFILHFHEQSLQDHIKT